MFEKFAASDARNAARSESSLNKDGKDVFTRAEEEAKQKLGEEAVTGSSDLEKKCTSENKEDTSTTDNGVTTTEEGKIKDGEETVTGSSDLEKSCSSERKDDTSTTGKDQGKLMVDLFNVY